MYSIVIPTVTGSKTFEMCVEYLRKNSYYKNEIVKILDEKDVYYAFNSGVYRAENETVVLMNDDMIVSKNWDILIPKYAKDNVILTGHVVESNPGKMISGPECVKYDCGTHDDFDYDKFQSFVDDQSSVMTEYKNDSLGWYMPIVVNQKTFVTYPNINKFPWYANDVTLIEKILPFVGFKFKQIRSFVYHFSKVTTKQLYTEEQLLSVPEMKK
jgi:hypothetical protein